LAFLPSVSPYQREAARFGGLTSLMVAMRKSSCRPLPAPASSTIIVRHDCESMPVALGSSAMVRSLMAACAAAAEPKTTFADESFTHSTHCGAASWGVTPGTKK